MTTTAIQYGAALPASAKRLPELLGATAIAEDLGAGLVTVADHPYLPSELDAWTLVLLLLARTSRVRVATNVTALPFRSPTVIAKAAASTTTASTTGCARLSPRDVSRPPSAASST